jgi:hypothetical protein
MIKISASDTIPNPSNVVSFSRRHQKILHAQERHRYLPLGCREQCVSCLMIRSSFCVVSCGEVVNVRLRNILNSTEPREKRYTGALRASRPHIFVLTLVGLLSEIGEHSTGNRHHSHRTAVTNTVTCLPC